MIKGNIHPDWAIVADVFRQNFDSHGELGAAVAVVYRGELVVNQWAGTYSNRVECEVDQPWQETTLANVFSVGKGLVAIAVLQLVDQGFIDLDRAVAYYWPEFAGSSKGQISVRQILSHQSGLSAFHEKLADADIYQWEHITKLLEVETPWWEPGTAQGYSPFIYGWILGELVCRVTGSKTFDEYFQQHIAARLNVQVHFGVPTELLNQIADTGPLKRTLDKINSPHDATSAALGNIMKADPRGVTNRAFTNPLSLMTSTNSTAWRQAQIPAANAHTSAKALARIYGDLALHQPTLLSPDTQSLCWQEQTFQKDQVLGLPLRFSHGFMLSRAERPDCSYGRGTRAFGHPGAGGSLGFADPDFEIGFGYVTSRMGQSLLIDDRAVNLIDAVYQVVEKMGEGR